jgi:predicted phospho-2-dehydro-3-deoxyheptonate aldolase
MRGRERRLARIFREDGRALVVPIDHPLSLGPVRGLERPANAVTDVLDGGADAMLMHRGPVAAGIWPPEARAGLVVHLSAGTELSGRSELKTCVCGVEEAIRLGADAVSVHISLGTGEDAAALAHLAASADACSEWCMPLIAMMYVYGPNATPKSIAHAARIACELGADAVKVAHPGDDDALAALVDGCFVPVLLAGGAASDPLGFLRSLEQAVEAGVAGACIGRNVWQHESPRLFASALRAVIHDDVPADVAYSALETRDHRPAERDRGVAALA